jgi:hypothetical protein
MEASMGSVSEIKLVPAEQTKIPPIIFRPPTLLSRIGHSIQKIISLFHSEKNPVNTSLPSTIASLDTESMKRIFSYLSSKEYGQVCKCFHFYSTEQAKAIALELRQMDQDTGLLTAFGVAVPQNFEKASDIFTFINAIKEMVKNLNKNLPKSLLFSTSTQKLFSDIKKMKTQLQDAYNMNTFLTLAKESVKNCDSLSKASLLHRLMLADSVDHPWGWTMFYYNFFLFPEDVFASLKPKLQRFPRTIWKLTEPESETTGLLPKEIKDLIKRIKPEISDQIETILTDE